MKPMKWLPAVVLAIACSAPRCHELEADRLTVVQRAPNHVSLTFRIDGTQLLRRMLAPAASEAEFALSMAAMPDGRFKALLARARNRFEAGTAVDDPGRGPLRLAAWHWPDDGELRSRWQVEAAQAVVEGAAHKHAGPLEVRVDAIADRPVERIGLRLPEALDGLVVVSYRPVESRYRAGQKGPLAIDFGGARR